MVNNQTRSKSKRGFDELPSPQFYGYVTIGFLLLVFACLARYACMTASQPRIQFRPSSFRLQFILLALSFYT